MLCATPIVGDIAGSDVFSCLLSFSLSLSAKTRLAGLESLRQAFSSRLLYDFLTERRLTVSDCLERSLKKGKLMSKFCLPSSARAENAQSCISKAKTKTKSTTCSF